MNWIIKTDEFIAKVLMAISLFCVTSLFFILFSNILLRTFRVGSLMNWYSEVVEILFSWLVMSIASLLCRNKGHFVVDLFVNKFGNKVWYNRLRIFVTLIPLVFFSIFLFYCVRFFQSGVQTMPILQIQRKWSYLCLPVNAFFLCVYSLRDFIEAIRNAFIFKPISKVEAKN